MKSNTLSSVEGLKSAITQLEENAKARREDFELPELFEDLCRICDAADKRTVLLIDEVDSAANNQVFLDFLAQLRASYISRDIQTTFQSVILAGVYKVNCLGEAREGGLGHDVRNLRRKLRPDDEHKVNSPWNIAADFNIDMSFSKEEIAGMLQEYEMDYHTGMDISGMSGLLYDYTSGYPFLVSRLCKLVDEVISRADYFGSKSTAWTKNGFNEAVKLILSEKNTLFESLIGKLQNYPELNSMLESLLFTGKSIVYNVDNMAIDKSGQR